MLTTWVRALFPTSQLITHPHKEDVSVSSLCGLDGVDQSFTVMACVLNNVPFNFIAGIAISVEWMTWQTLYNKAKIPNTLLGYNINMIGFYLEKLQIPICFCVFIWQSYLDHSVTGLLPSTELVWNQLLFFIYSIWKKMDHFKKGKIDFWYPSASPCTQYNTDWIIV